MILDATLSHSYCDAGNRRALSPAVGTEQVESTFSTSPVARSTDNAPRRFTIIDDSHHMRLDVHGPGDKPVHAHLFATTEGSARLICADRTTCAEQGNAQTGHTYHTVKHFPCTERQKTSTERHRLK